MDMPPSIIVLGGDTYTPFSVLHITSRLFTAQVIAVAYFSPIAGYTIRLTVQLNDRHALPGGGLGNAEYTTCL